MKTNIFVILAVLSVFACRASATAIWIDSVDVIPSQPLDIDLITFDISGRTASGGPQIVYDQFSQNGTSLQLDLYINMGPATMITPWTYSRQIQPLLPATYSMEVRAFWYVFDTLEDTYNVNFTVVPEPGTLAILGFALPVFRIFSRKKI